jgi:hypothetical protein
VAPGMCGFCPEDERWNHRMNCFEHERRRPEDHARAQPRLFQLGDEPHSLVGLLGGMQSRVIEEPIRFAPAKRVAVVHLGPPRSPQIGSSPLPRKPREQWDSEMRLYGSPPVRQGEVGTPTVG